MTFTFWTSTHWTSLPSCQNIEAHFKPFITIIIRILGLWTSPVLSLMGTSRLFNEPPGSPLSTGFSGVNSRCQRSQDHRLHNASDCWLLMLRWVLRVGVGFCVCIVCICLIVCIYLFVHVSSCECMCEQHFYHMHFNMFACVLMHAKGMCVKEGTWLAGPPRQMKLDGLQTL